MRNLMLFAAVAAVAAPIASAEAFYRAGGWNGGGRSWGGGGGVWHATGPNGGTAWGGHVNGHYNGGYYGGYHPPTVVNNYSTGCYNCGGWNAGGAAAVGLVGGAMLGAAAASASNANAYNAGVAAGAAAASAGYVVGNLYPALPAGCTYQPQGGTPEYNCSGGVWFTPAYGANGVYYRAIPSP